MDVEGQLQCAELEYRTALQLDQLSKSVILGLAVPVVMQFYGPAF